MLPLRTPTLPQVESVQKCTPDGRAFQSALSKGGRLATTAFPKGGRFAKRSMQALSLRQGASDVRGPPKGEHLSARALRSGFEPEEAAEEEEEEDRQ